MKLVCATGNAGKLKEIREILAGSDIEVFSMKEMGINTDINENGTSFYENALIKSQTIKNALDCNGEKDCIVLSDDSGLEIDYLGGAPGIYSARFMGEDTNYEIKNNALIEKLNGVSDEKRTARFACSMVAIMPDGKELTSYETMEGIIARKPGGTNGFGYDPILYLPDYGCTSAELDPAEKNRISHRGKALREIVRLILECNL